jgi:hypothetical protein
METGRETIKVLPPFVISFPSSSTYTTNQLTCATNHKLMPCLIDGVMNIDNMIISMQGRAYRTIKDCPRFEHVCIFIIHVLPLIMTSL